MVNTESKTNPSVPLVPDAMLPQRASDTTMVSVRWVELVFVVATAFATQSNGTFAAHVGASVHVEQRIPILDKHPSTGVVEAHLAWTRWSLLVPARGW